MPDDLTLDLVAQRLGKSRRWVQARIREPGLKFHHYIGRSPRWDERGYQALRQAIIAADSATAAQRASGGDRSPPRNDAGARAL